MNRFKSMNIKSINGGFFILGYLCFLFISSYILNLASLSFPFLFLNILFISMLYFAILLITGHPVFAMPIASFLVFIINYLDTCVFAARLTHLRISDFFVVTQAMRIASHYKLVWSIIQWKQFLVLILFSTLLILIHYVSHIKSDSFLVRITSISILIILSIIMIEGTIFHVIPVVKNFSNYNSNGSVKEAGLIAYWYSQVVNRKSKKPIGYSSEKAKKILNDYTDDVIYDINNSVNIIVIMNESLADYSLLGKIQFNDPLPYIHSMVESGKMFEGKMATSVLGGGTCNTEYEFLTGHSLRFLPNGVYAFTAYVNDKSDSIARELEPLGFCTSFFHPYYSQEWNREAVYSFFGFDSFMAGDTLEGGFRNKNSVEDVTQFKKDEPLIFGEDLKYKRTFISDSQTYKLLADMLAFDDSVSNDFAFCVTIQNHGGYEYEGDDFKNIEYITADNGYKDVSGINGETCIRGISAVNQYLTLSNLSDSAFCELIEILSKVNEKTMVVMFGDHQPGIDISNYIKYNKNINLSVAEETHTVPYFVWSNFDIDYEFPKYISANFLSSIIKDSINLPLNAWDKFRLDVMKKYPVITTEYVLDSDYCVVSDTNSNLLRDYSYVQYMRMFE